MAKIHDVDIKERILAGKSKEVTTTIPAKAYLSKVKNNNSSIKFFTLGGVPGADSTLKQTYVNHNSVELVKPVLEFKVNGKVRISNLLYSIGQPYSSHCSISLLI